MNVPQRCRAVIGATESDTVMLWTSSRCHLAPGSASQVYDRGVRIKPFGWELAAALAAMVALAASILLGFEVATLMLLALLAAIAPLVLLSAGARLVAGMVRETRRHSRATTVRP